MQLMDLTEALNILSVRFMCFIFAEVRFTFETKPLLYIFEFIHTGSVNNNLIVSGESYYTNQ